MRGTRVYVPLLLFQGFITFVQPSQLSEIRALIKDVFTGYYPYLKPECGGATNVTVDMALRQIIELDGPTQEMKINVWMRMKWNDCRLRWNASDYNKEFIYMPAKRLWIPDITLFDSTSGDFFPGLYDHGARVRYDGTVYYNWPTVLGSFCHVDVKFFPMDTQTCQFMFCSWMHHGGEIDWFLGYAEGGDLSNYNGHAGWAVEKYTAAKHVIYYNCCKEPYPDLTFYIDVRRRPLNFMICIVYPCLLLAGLTLLGFLMPVESGEKVSLQVTLMLSFDVFLLVMSENIPASTSIVPVLLLFFALSMAMVSFSCVLTVVIILMHFKAHSKVPAWVKKYIICGLGKLLCVSSVDQYKVSNIQSTQTTQNVYTVEQLQNKPPEEQKTEMQAKGKVQWTVNEVVRCLRRIQMNFQCKDVEENRSSEWHALATVMDRLFFFVLFSFLVVSSVVIYVD